MDCMPDEARDGRNVALNYQVTCWCARSSKGTILLRTNGVVYVCTSITMHGACVCGSEFCVRVVVVSLIVNNPQVYPRGVE